MTARTTQVAEQAWDEGWDACRAGELANPYRTTDENAELRTLADVTARDLGRTLTFTGPDWSVTGSYLGGDWAVDVIEERELSGRDSIAVGSYRGTLVVGPAHVTIYDPTVITVQEARP